MRKLKLVWFTIAANCEPLINFSWSQHLLFTFDYWNVLVTCKKPCNAKVFEVTHFPSLNSGLSYLKNICRSIPDAFEDLKSDITTGAIIDYHQNLQPLVPTSMEKPWKWEEEFVHQILPGSFQNRVYSLRSKRFRGVWEQRTGFF